jgi:hypothetical protein
VAGSQTEPEAAVPPGYVLVPVPEELVARVSHEVMRLQWMAQGVAQPWPLDEIVDLLLASDELVTNLVRSVARAEIQQRTLDDVEVAEHLGISTRELAGIIREVNDSGPTGVLDLLVLHREHRAGNLVREVRMMGEHARRVEEAVAIARRRRTR